jgi:hypothetical protein
MVMAGALTLIVLVMVGTALATLMGQDDPLTARVDHASGVVELNSSGSEEWLRVQAGVELQAGDRMRSGIESMAVLRFPDESITELGENSQLSILQLATSRSGDGQIAVLHQYEGQTVHSVKPQNPDYSWFEVETSSASVTVIGTEFAVEVTAFQATIVTVSKGVVEVDGQGAVLQVEAGHVASVLPGSEPVLGLPVTAQLPTCVQDTAIIEPPVCDDELQDGDMASPSPGPLLDQESGPGSDTSAADLNATATSGSQLTPTPTPTPIKGMAPTSTPFAGGAPTISTMTPPSENPTEEGAAPYEPTTTPTGPSSPPPTATPYYPSATATPVQPTAPPQSSTPLPTALPPTSTPFPTVPPPTSTPPPTSPPPTSTPPPPPTATPVPPTPTNIPTTATPPPPTPTPPPYP